MFTLYGVYHIAGEQGKGLPDGGASSTVGDVFEDGEIRIYDCAYCFIKCCVDQQILQIPISPICHDDFERCEWGGLCFGRVEVLFDGLIEGT